MKTNEDQIYSFLGLATRAGKIVSGDDQITLRSYLKINLAIEMYHMYISQVNCN